MMFLKAIYVRDDDGKIKRHCIACIGMKDVLVSSRRIHVCLYDFGRLNYFFFLFDDDLLSVNFNLSLFFVLNALMMMMR